MNDSWAAGAVELLIDQAEAARVEGRYPSAVAAAARAVEGAEYLDHPSLRIRALQVEADALRMSGDHALALARYTRILGLVEDPTLTTHLDPLAIRAVANTYADWVDSARIAGGVPIRRLFSVLDAAERWLTAAGHPDWRAPVLLQRALVHHTLGDLDQAVAAAQEALSAHRSDCPGYTLAAHRSALGDILREADRAVEAEPLYHAILDDPTTSAYTRAVAWQGLAQCALDRDDPTTAIAHARTAVDLAGALSDYSVVSCVPVLVAAYRAAGDLDSAGQAAAQHLNAARRVGGHRHLYFAVRDAVDVALDRGDHTDAATLLDELDHHAAALDHDTGTDDLRREIERRRARRAHPTVDG